VDPLAAVMVSGVPHGTPTLHSYGSFTYTPAANYNGSDSFTYKANDSHVDSTPATVSITINPVNDAPVAVPDFVTTDEDTPLTGRSVERRVGKEGDSLTAVLVSGVTHGTLTLNANGSFTYTPAANYNGSDSFTYKANDSHVDSTAATVSITINPVNDAPVAVPDFVTTDEDTPLTG